MSQNRPLLTFVGVATEDSIAVVDRYPSSNERVRADSVTFGGGGPAATAAVAAARLGMRAALIAAVGDDEAGEVVRQRLSKEGVDVSCVRTVPGANTARSVVVISGDEHSRAISNMAGPEIELTSDAANLIADSEWVHVDQHGWKVAHAHLRDTGGPRLSVDAGNSIPSFDLAGTALFVPTVEALAAMYPDDDASAVEALMRRTVTEGAEQVVVTDGGRGAYGLVDGDIAHAAVPRTEVVSTLGAGDVFHGALLAALVHLANGEIAGGLGAALSYATTAASLSCRGVDGRSRIPTHDDVLAHLNN